MPLRPRTVNWKNYFFNTNLTFFCISKIFFGQKKIQVRFWCKILESGLEPFLCLSLNAISSFKMVVDHLETIASVFMLELKLATLKLHT